MLPPVVDDPAVDPQLVAVVVLIPCVCMILGEAAMSVQVNRWVQAASQNLSAGIILGALSNEIQPMVTGLLSGQSYLSAMLAVSVGSTLALALNFLIARIGEEDDEEVVKESAVELQSLAPSDDLEQSARLDVYGSAGGTVVEKLLGLMKEVQHDVGKLEQESVDRSLFDSTVHSLEHKMHTMLRVVSRTPGWTTQERQRVLEHADELYDEVEQLANTLERVKAEGTPNAEYLPTATTELLIRQISKAEAVVEHLHSHVERSTFRRWGPLMHGGMSSLMGEDFEAPKPKMVLIFTVTIDAIVDGFLIGLCAVSDATTAYIMAGATSLEMGFLGLAYAAFLKDWKMSKGVHLLTLAIPPIMMAVAGYAGSVIGEMLIKNVLLFLGMLSFASVSLVYLVTQELLIEAHESTEGPGDLQTAWLFVGLLVAFMMSTATDAEQW